MRVLVTGGAGFIGSHTVEALLEAGAEVVVLDDFSAGKHANLPQHPRLRVMEGDIRDRSMVEQALDGVTHVLHLAAQVSVRSSIEAPSASASHNVVGFLTVLDALRRRGIPRLVYASSAAVYGAPRTLPLDEDSPCAPESPYGLEKLINDQYAALFSALYGISALGMRYFNVYGPRQDAASPYAGVISRFAARLKGDEPLTVFGDGLQTRDFVFVKDVAAANVAALRSSATGVLNIGTGTSVTLLQLIEALARCAGRTPTVKFDPPAAGDIRHSAMRPDRMQGILAYCARTPLHEGLRTLI